MYHIHNATIISPFLFRGFSISSLQFDFSESWHLHLLKEYRRTHFALVAIPLQLVYRALLHPLYVRLLFHYILFVKQVRFQRHFESFSVDSLQNILRCYGS